jgi:undecaprenyl-diphosphatase
MDRTRLASASSSAITTLRGWARQRDMLVVSLVFLACALTYVFFEISEAVAEDEFVVDKSILLALRNDADPSVPVGPAWLKEVWRDITALGGGIVVGLVGVVVTGYLALLREWRTVAAFAGALIGAGLGSTILKQLFGRARPDVVEHLVDVSTLSFPSGHSLLSAVAYPTLGVLLARVVKTRSLKLYCMGVALLLMVLVGFSRVYLGVHYPSDVLAGWCLGLAWSIVVWMIVRTLQRKGAIEEQGTEPVAT